MGASSIGVLRFSILILLLSGSHCLEWDASNFPNPTAGDYKQCRMRTTSNICDPDEVLTESERYRINHELHQLESRTRQDHAPDFCQKKGITAAMAVLKHISGNSDQKEKRKKNVKAAKEMANEILRKWTLDKQCKKSVVFVVVTEDRRFWVARDSRVPVYAQEFTEIFNSQKPLFRQGNYAQALGNIIQQTWDKALSKQGGAEFPDGDKDGKSAFRPEVPSPTRGIRPVPGDDKKHKSILPSIPWWFFALLVLVLVPVVCCVGCCLCYCCLCRKDSGGTASSPRRQGPQDIESNRGRPMSNIRGRTQQGGGSGLFNNILGGLGGAGLGHLAGQLLSGGSKRRNVPAYPGYQSGGAYPAEPVQPSRGYDGGGARGTAKGGRGLYPSVNVHDEGGGGGW